MLSEFLRGAEIALTDFGRVPLSTSLVTYGLIFVAAFIVWRRERRRARLTVPRNRPDLWYGRSWRCPHGDGSLMTCVACGRYITRSDA